MGLFDYLADLFGFDDSAMGRFKTALLTFIPPMIGGLVKPDGFLYAIGMLAWRRRSGRRLYRRCWLTPHANASGSPQFRVWGGTPMIVLILLLWPRQCGCTYPVERQSAAGLSVSFILSEPELPIWLNIYMHTFSYCQIKVILNMRNVYMCLSRT